MPRCKPVFSDFEYLFKDMVYSVDTQVFNKNTKIQITCPKGHVYVTSITKIQSLNHKYKECPHCLKEQEYNTKRVSLEEIEKVFENTSFIVHNKKPYYKKWGDILELQCTKDNHIVYIKSLSHWIDEGMGIPECSKCLEKKVLSPEEYTKEINRITDDTYSFTVVLPEPKIAQTLSDAASSIIQKYNWHIQEYNGTKKKSSFICKTCGYIKETLVFNLRGCIECEKRGLKNGVKNKLKTICESSNIFINQDAIYTKIDAPINFKCNDCSHEFSLSWLEINSRYYNIHCPKCYGSTKRKSQTEVFDFIKTIYDGVVLENDTTKISPRELDIFIPGKNIAIEYCGNIWHSEKYKKDKNYHYDKYKTCLEKGIYLITIFEDEWKHTNDICKSRIQSLLGCNTNRIYARDCIIKYVNSKDAKQFMGESHLQGYAACDETIGLYYNEELVSAMLFKNVEGGQNDCQWDLVRFANKKYTSIVGGASKILKAFSQAHKGQTLSTYSDSRWCDGEFYKKIGFSHVYDIAPGYYYVGVYTQWRLKHRFTFKKDRLMKIFNETDASKSEHQIALENGLYRVYDCGHKKFILTM